MKPYGYPKPSPRMQKQAMKDQREREGNSSFLRSVSSGVMDSSMDLDAAALVHKILEGA